MLRAKRPVLASILATTLVLTSSLPMASFAAGKSVDERPGEVAMIGDTLLARPTLIGSTVIGAVLWVVTLPFSALGGNVGEAGKTLVVAPAKNAFVRCLGCTPAQHESLASVRRTEKKQKQMAKAEQQ